MKPLFARFPMLLLPAFASCISFLNAGTIYPLTYEIIGDSVTITKVEYLAQGDIVIPALIEGKPVTAIGNRACNHNNFVTSVTLPSSVRTIGDYSFSGCGFLTSLHMEEGLQEIGVGAISNCRYLKTLTIPSTVTHIGEAAFQICRQLESVILPPSLATINRHLFDSCTALRECKIPDGVTAIGDEAFRYSGLEQVTIPPKVKMLGTAVFRDCASLRRANLPEGLTVIGDQAFYSCTSLKRINLPKGLKHIGGSTLRETALSDLQLDGVKTIGAKAFTGCNQLVTVRIPKSVTSIGDQAFSECGRLAAASFAGNAPQMGKAVFGSHAGDDFTLFVDDTSRGFSVPRWLGYRLSLPRPEIAVHGFQRPYLSRNEAYTHKCGQVPVGKRSAPQIFKLTNVGNRPLTSIRARIKGGDASDFIIVLPPKVSLAPGKSTTVEIVLRPSMKGKRSTTLELESSDSNERLYSIRLTGTGIKFL